MQCMDAPNVNQPQSRPSAGILTCCACRFRGSKAEPLSRDDLAARMAEGTVIILDIRPADEFELGHKPGATNVALSDLQRLVPVLDPDAKIIAYCRGPYCIFAHQAVAALRKHGLNARRLEGGLPEWRTKGREVSTV